MKTRNSLWSSSMKLLKNVDQILHITPGPDAMTVAFTFYTAKYPFNKIQEEFVLKEHFECALVAINK